MPTIWKVKEYSKQYLQEELNNLSMLGYRIMSIYAEPQANGRTHFVVIACLEEDEKPF